MRIEVVDPVVQGDYIRHARTETLKALTLEPLPALIEPVSVSTYVLAFDDITGRPIAMGESAMLSSVYGSYDDTPYAALGDLNTFCPVHEMGGMRTIFVEPEYRNNSSLFLALTLYSAKLFHQDCGARYATATTLASDVYLNTLYAKYCGTRVGKFPVAPSNELSSLYVFDIEQILSLRVARRVLRNFDTPNLVAH